MSSPMYMDTVFAGLFIIVCRAISVSRIPIRISAMEVVLWLMLSDLLFLFVCA